MALAFIQENDASRRRLATLVHSLSDQDLARSTDYGWTVAALLAHLAFWDQRVVVILKRWKETGFDLSPIDSTAVNDALKALCHALDPHTAVELCLACAEAADAELAALTPDLVKQIEEHIEATATQFRMDRSLHRNGHLNDMEALLKRDR
ncbi:MAG TPA: maleylpyruvate isomerase N-terminal domain-containing protein [Anaerolineales bacterium]|nr:maleylpyruvate isomerase N-terminal domain-containing protein [Anaerolineales bacterium]